MRLSHASEYGLEGLVVLARKREGTVMLLDEIAHAGRLPARFLAQIFQKLRRHHLVTSHRGAVRGYELARPAREITLRAIFEAIEGPELFERCVFWPERCDDGHPCRLHARWATLRPRVQGMIDRTTLDQVARGRRRRGAATVLVGWVLAASLGLAGIQSWAQPADKGRTLFQEKCAACHTIGQGDLVGPDLKGVTVRRDREWLVRWLRAPDRMLTDGDPIATALLRQYKNLPMPNQGLTEEQVATLMAFLETGVAASGAMPITAQPFAAASGDPLLGRALFTGAARFRNGGPSCMACHSVAGIGALGGGALGPDLTGSYGKYGEAGIASVLAAPPFLAMSPIYRDRPLTQEEQAHLTAFLRQAALAERSPEAVGRLAALAVIGAGVLLAVVGVSWRRRLTEVRRLLLSRARR